MQLYDENVILPETCSNRRHTELHYPEPIPWRYYYSDTTVIIARLITQNPSVRNDIMGNESESCHVSVSRRMSIPRSALRSRRSSILLLSDLMLSRPKVEFFLTDMA